jgi:hypothetical protein
VSHLFAILDQDFGIDGLGDRDGDSARDGKRNRSRHEKWDTRHMVILRRQDLSDPTITPGRKQP